MVVVPSDGFPPSFADPYSRRVSAREIVQIVTDVHNPIMTWKCLLYDTCYSTPAVGERSFKGTS